MFARVLATLLKNTLISEVYKQFPLGDHSFGAYATYSEKLTFLTP